MTCSFFGFCTIWFTVTDTKKNYRKEKKIKTKIVEDVPYYLRLPFVLASAWTIQIPVYNKESSQQYYPCLVACECIALWLRTATGQVWPNPTRVKKWPPEPGLFIICMNSDPVRLALTHCDPYALTKVFKGNIYITFRSYRVKRAKFTWTRPRDSFAI